MAKENIENKIYNIAFYMRLSREDGDKGESSSIENQRRVLKKYIADKENFVFFEEYIDDGVSGTSFNRPGFLRMLKDIEGKKINCVMTKDLSRLGRNYIDAGAYINRYFDEYGVRYISVNDSVDTAIDDGGMITSIKNIFNEQYSKDISTKVQSAFKVKQEAGEFVGAFPSYGYQKASFDRHKLIIDEYSASIVRRIFHMYMEGKGKIGIAKQLNKEGVLSPTAYKNANGLNYTNGRRLQSTSYWTYSSINAILKNEMYIGHMVQGKTKRKMRQKPKMLEQEDWIVVPNTHEAIIDDVTWNKVQNLLKREVKQIDLKQNVSIFAGFLKCGDCGRALSKKNPYVRKGMVRDSSSMKGVSYSCSSYIRYGREHCSPHKISHEALEQIVLKDLNMIIQAIEDLKHLIEQQKHNIPKNSQVLNLEKSRVHNELNKVKRLKREIYEDYKEELISKADFLLYQSEYGEKESNLEKKLEQLEEKLEQNGEQDIFKAPWIKELLELQGISKLDRTIITDMIDSIYVYEEHRVKIVYNFSNEMDSFFDMTIKIIETA